MTSILKKTALIAIDWGTSNFRAFMLDHAGNILESRFAKCGLLHIRNKDFYGKLQEQIGDHLATHYDIPIIMSGMVGSRQGWEEVPYLNCPIELETLARHLYPIKTRQNAWIVPGIRIDYPDGRVDVMRGEETQILGSQTFCNSETTADSKNDIQTLQLFCLPGTHSKWAWIQEGKLDHFYTFMTGEIFNLLFKQSILGKHIKRVYSNVKAFYRGLEWAERPEHFMSQLFQVRTQMLSGNLVMEDIHSFLSGLVIGHEVIDILRTVLTTGVLPARTKLTQTTKEEHPCASLGQLPWEKSFTQSAKLLPCIKNTASVHIIANSHISKFYAKALVHYGMKVTLLNADQVSAQGIFKIASLAGLIKTPTIHEDVSSCQ